MPLGRPHIRRTGGALLCLLVLLALAVPSTAPAEGFERDTTPLSQSVRDAGDEKADDGSGGGAGAGSVARMVVGLAVVLAVIYGLYWLLRTHARGKAGRSAGGLAVVASTALGQNRALHLVRVGDELVLLAVAENAVATVRVYDADETRRLGPLLDNRLDGVSPADISGRTVADLVEGMRLRTARR